MPIEIAPNPDSYVIGRGKVSLAQLDADGNAKGFRFLGNAPDFGVTGTKEQVEHISSITSLAVVDKRIILSQGFTMKFTLDEIENFDNLAQWLAGSTGQLVNGAVAGFTVWQLVADGDIVVGNTYLLRSSTGERAFSVDEADLTLITTETIPVPLVLNTDYTVDELMGTFTLLDTAVVTTAIGTGDGINVTLAANALAVASLDKVTALDLQSQVFAVLFQMENAANNGSKIEILMPKVTLSSDGDMNLIGRDFATMQFQGSVEAGDTTAFAAVRGEYIIITDPND